MARQNMIQLVMVTFAGLVFIMGVVASGQESADKAAPAETASQEEDPRRELFSGKVVLLQEALKQRGIKVADEMKLQAVLETKSGELIPIAADWRGRAFFQDRKLRDRPVEIVGYRRHGIPYLQALIVYFFNKQGEREEFDYWCDICSIPMYEIKDCECCQGPSRHRYRPAELPDYLFQQKPAGTQDSPQQEPPSTKKPSP